MKGEKKRSFDVDTHPKSSNYFTFIIEKIDKDQSEGRKTNFMNITRLLVRRDSERNQKQLATPEKEKTTPKAQEAAKIPLTTFGK
jgi:hypothetical protein